MLRVRAAALRSAGGAAQHVLVAVVVAVVVLVLVWVVCLARVQVDRYGGGRVARLVGGGGVVGVGGRRGKEADGGVVDYCVKSWIVSNLLRFYVL